MTKLYLKKGKKKQNKAFNNKFIKTHTHTHTHTHTNSYYNLDLRKKTKARNLTINSSNL